MMDFMKVGNHKKIAITGIAGGGKSVFLTSILSHLSEYGNSDFHINKGIDITDFRTIPLGSKWPPQFAHSKYRENIAKKQWPAKTTDCAKYCCAFRRSDWTFFRQKLTFFDFPGERVADAAIAKFSDYGDWSDHILNHFSERNDYVVAANPYLEYLKSETISQDTLLLKYREVLAKLILEFKPLISPSTFLLDITGSPAEREPYAEIAAKRFTGISQDEQFAPLPKESREKNPQLAKTLAASYKRYRREIALPVFENVLQATKLVVLIDIPSLLAGGVGRYNDNRQIMIDLFEVLRPGSDIGAILLKYFKYTTGLFLLENSLESIAFVAAKTDMIHPLDIENGRTMDLLKMITDRPKRMLPDVECEWFVCSACHSTFPVGGERRLRGRLAFNNPEKEFKEYDVPELPSAWPDNWKARDYLFYKVYPDAPENYLKPPRHIGLDKIVEFLLK